MGPCLPLFTNTHEVRAHIKFYTFFGTGSENEALCSGAYEVLYYPFDCLITEKLIVCTEFCTLTDRKCCLYTCIVGYEVKKYDHISLIKVICLLDIPIFLLGQA